MALFDPNAGFTQNSDYGADQDALLRKRKLMDSMLAKMQGTPITANNNTARMIQGLAGTASMYMNMQGAADSDAALKSNSQARQADLLTNLQAFTNMKNGQSGAISTQQAGDLMNNDIQPDFKEQIAPDPRQAVIRAMASQHPEMQAIGKAEYANLGKKTYTDHVVGDKLFRTDDGGTTKELAHNPKPIEQWTPLQVMGADGKMLEAQKSTTSGEIRIIDKGMRVTTNVDLGKAETETQKAIGKKVPEVLEAHQATMENSVKAIASADRLTELAKDPAIISGFAADKVLGLAQLATKLKFTGPDAAAKTEALLGEMASSTMEASKNLKGSISDKEKSFLQEAAAGRISWTPQAVQHLAGIVKANAHNNLMLADKNRQSALKLPGAEGGDLLYPAPGFSTKFDDNYSHDNFGRVTYNGNFGAAPGSKPTGVQPSGDAPRIIKW